MGEERLYPHLPQDGGTADPSSFRMTRIVEIQKILQREQEVRTAYAKKYRRSANIVEGVSTTFASASVISGVGSVSLLSTIVAAPAAVALSTVAAGTGLFCMVLRLVGRKLALKSRKHDRIMVLARAKKNSIDVIISKAIIDNEISDIEFKMVVDEMTRYQELKDEIRTKVIPKMLSDADIKKLITEERADERKNLLSRLGT